MSHFHQSFENEIDINRIFVNRQDSDSETGDEPESEEDASDPYPLDGRYKDEADRQRCGYPPSELLDNRIHIIPSRCRIMELPEFEREELLAQRAEELQKFKDSFALDAMYKAQTGASAGASGGDDT